MKLDLIKIGLHPARLQNDNAPSYVINENNYYAIAVEDSDKYYYWAKGVSMEVTKEELDRVRANPVLYYFSTALRLHCRINRNIERRN